MSPVPVIQAPMSPLSPGPSPFPLHVSAPVPVIKRPNANHMTSHRPRTASTNSRLPIFQVLCTETEEEAAPAPEATADPSAAVSRTLSSSLG